MKTKILIGLGLISLILMTGCGKQVSMFHTNPTLVNKCDHCVNEMLIFENQETPVKGCEEICGKYGGDKSNENWYCLPNDNREVCN